MLLLLEELPFKPHKHLVPNETSFGKMLSHYLGVESHLYFSHKDSVDTFSV